MQDNRIPYYSSIKFRTLTGIFLITVTPLVILGYYAFEKINELSRNMLIKTNFQAVSQAKTEIEDFTRRYRMILGIIAADRRLSEGTDSTFELLTQFDREFEFIERLILVNSSGDIICRPSSGSETLDSQEKELLEKKQEFLITPGKWIISRALNDSENSERIIASVALTELTKQLDRISLGTSFRIYIIGRNGDNILNKIDFPQEIIKDLCSREYGAYDVSADGKNISQVAVVLPVLHYGLKVVVTQDADEVFLLMKSVQRNVFFVIASMGLLSVFFGVFFSLQISSPIIAIARKVNEISEGNLSARIGIRRNDEIGFLAQCFDNMAEKILHKIFELSALFQISQIISRSAGYQEILDKILDQLILLFKARRGSIMLLTDQNENLRLTAVKIYDQKTGTVVTHETKEVVELRYGEGIAGQVVRTGSPVLSVDCENDPRFKQYRNSDGYSAPKTLISVPLIVKDKPFGVINLSDRLDNSMFTSGDMELLLTIATQIAISLDNSKLYEMAIRDGLTGLYIYRYFQIRLEEETVRSRRYKDPLSLMMIDIDFFKKVNDTYGHQQGDIVLRETAAVIHSTARATDVACRYGGEEFALILPNTTAEQAVIFAERLRKKIEDHLFPGQDQTVRATVSIGIAEYPSHADSRNDLIAHADLALYFSKHHGRNRCSVYHQTMEKNNENSD